MCQLKLRVNISTKTINNVEGKMKKENYTEKEWV